MFFITGFALCLILARSFERQVQATAATRAEAVRIGRAMVMEELIHHCVDDHDFKDQNLFFRFMIHEQPSYFSSRSTCLSYFSLEHKRHDGGSIAFVALRCAVYSSLDLLILFCRSTPLLNSPRS